MFKTSKNPRVWKSLNKTSLAFFEVLKIKDISRITISEICFKAGITRKTFYRDFTSLEDVLDFAVFSAAGDFIRTSSDKTLSDFLKHLTAFAYVNKDRLLVLEERGLLAVAASFFVKHLLGDEVFRKSLVSANIVLAERSEYDLALLLGAETGLLERWVHGGCQETPDQLVAISLESINHFSSNK